MACDPYVSVSGDVTMASLETVLVEADFLSIHAPLTDETEGLLDEARLATMKKTAYIVNCSDASIIDRTALVDALRSRSIAGAAVDVFETHPVAPDNPLIALNNVILSPHVGGATAETIERHSRTMTDDVLRFLDGERPKNLVNPEAWNRSSR
jgi:phosphoglycerate dehydrogenase-like enzyme